MWRRQQGQTSPSWWRAKLSWRSRFQGAWTGPWHLCGRGWSWAGWQEQPWLLPQGLQSHCRLLLPARGCHTHNGCSPRWDGPQCTLADIWLLWNRKGKRDINISIRNVQHNLLFTISFKPYLAISSPFASTVPGHGLFPHFCISTGRPAHCTVIEDLTQVLLRILRPPPQVAEQVPHRPHGLHLADYTERERREKYVFEMSFQNEIDPHLEKQHLQWHL